MLGTVKWFNKEKGFGFIVSGGQDYFVHFKEIQAEGYKALADNDKVEFEPLQTHKGWSAKQVRVCK